MAKTYTKLEVIQMVASYFQANDCKNLYKDKCINFRGETKDTKENYSKVIVDYLVEHFDEFKTELNNIKVTRERSYKTKSHTGKSEFDFDKRPSGERREEKIAHAMYCQYKDVPAEFGKILDYQIPLKNKSKDKRIGKIDLISSKEGSKLRSKNIYFLELKRDSSKETLLRCILEAYTYSKIIDKEKLCDDFPIHTLNYEFVIAPLVYYADGFEKQFEMVKLLIKSLDIHVEIFIWDYKNGNYTIETLSRYLISNISL